MKGVRSIAAKDIQDDINDDRYHKVFFITNICQSWYNVGDLNKEVGASQVNMKRDND